MEKIVQTKVIQKSSSFIKELKEFAVKGNVMDLAVGVVIGGAFSKIVTSLVNDVITPFLGLIIGGISFSDWKIKLTNGFINPLGEKVPAITINIGTFIQACFDFAIVAMSIFAIIKLMNKLRKNSEPKDCPPPEKPEEIKILEEIRDLLKK